MEYCDILNIFFVLSNGIKEIQDKKINKSVAVPSITMFTSTKNVHNKTGSIFLIYFKFMLHILNL